MRRLFVEPGQISGNVARITGPDHLHLARVLRVRVGELLQLLDNTGKAYQGHITEVGKNETIVAVDGSVVPPPEPLLSITIAQALGKGDKLEQVIQHGTEAGASAFLPIRAERSTVDIPADRIQDRLLRWRQIAKGAAEQSGRSRIPEVQEPLALKALLGRLDCPALLLQPGANSILLRDALRPLFLASPARLVIAVGPEGGWSPAEVSESIAANMVAVTIGPRILRTETAALIAISQVLYAFEGENNSGD